MIFKSKYVISYIKKPSRLANQINITKSIIPLEIEVEIAAPTEPTPNTLIKIKLTIKFI